MPPTSGTLDSSHPLQPPQHLDTESANPHLRSPEDAGGLDNQVPNALLSGAIPTQSQARNEEGMSTTETTTTTTTTTFTTPPDQHASKLTFFQAYFTRPIISKDPEKKTTTGRRFSFLSIGFLISAAIMVAILVGVIVAAVVLSVHNGHKVHAESVSAPDPDDNDNESPIRGAIPSNFPDPSLFFDQGIWYAFATTNAAGVLPYPGQPPNASENTPDFGLANIQMATSTNFADWKLASLADQPLPTTGNWTTDEHHNKTARPHISSTWAPAVIKRPADGKYVMYYAAVPDGANPYDTRGKDGQISAPHPFPHCVGAAVSSGTSPAGPYEALDDFITCPEAQGGAIDPEVMSDVDGKIWLTYKIDGNNIGHGGFCGNTVDPIVPTPIMLQQMEDDGTTKVGDPVTILENIDSDGPLIEAPMLVRSPSGVYFLFFSSGCTRENTYAVKYATSRNIKGPYTRAKGTLLKTGDWGLEAPGSVGIVEDGQEGWNMAFHARSNYGLVGRVRSMWTTKLEFNDTTVKLVRDNTTVHLGYNGQSSS